MDNEPIYASVQDVDNGDEGRTRFVRQNSVRRKKSMAKKPPLPSRRTTSEEKSNDDNLPSRVQDAYAKAHKKSALPDDITSISEDIETDSHSITDQNPSGISSLTSKVNEAVVRRKQLSHSKSENINSSKAFNKQSPRLKRFQTSDASDSGIFQSKSGSQDELSDEINFRHQEHFDIWDVPVQLQHVIHLYQTKLIQKDELLEVRDAEISELETKLHLAEGENEELRKSLPDLLHTRLPTSYEEWRLLREQAQLVLEENELLNHQLEHLQEKLRENHVVHSKQATQLKQRLDASQTDKSTIQEELKQTRERFEVLRDQYNMLRLETVDSISREQHSESIRECRRLLDQLKIKYEDDLDNVISDLKTLQTDKCNLVTRITKLSNENQQLEVENRVLVADHKKCLLKLRQLRKQLTKTKMDRVSYRFKMNLLQTQVSKLVEDKNEYSLMVLRAFDEMSSVLLHIESKMLTAENAQRLKIAKVTLMENLKTELERMQDRTEKLLSKTLENNLKTRHRRRHRLFKRRENQS